ncbi:glycosyltransferase family protein [Butyrivibrio sp. NC3005]|uniref:glycosyltransferase family protein n=1 Tax=Butyrivibrio sp. NC3005 TaxID=1280685 RepID=UPI00047A4207|nr:hypothetical protein [Butyrivibrio sp. NC3005]
MKRVLLFHYPQQCYDTINIFSELLSKEFHKLGIETYKINLMQTDNAINHDLAMALKNDIEAVFAFNTSGQQNFTINNSNIFDSFEIPFFDYLLDSPIERYCKQKITSHNFYSICPDRNHVKFLDEHYKEVKKSFFLPLPGIESEKEYVENNINSFLKRPYRLSATMSYTDRSVLEEKIGLMEDFQQRLVFDQIDMMLEDRTLSNSEVQSLVLEKYGMKKEDVNESMRRQIDQLTTTANIYVRGYYREEIVRYLIAGNISIDIFGSGWDKLDISDFGKVRIHNPVTYFETADICRKSQMTLNVMPRFMDGMHDRIPTSMLSGSVCVTDKSKYLEEIVRTKNSENRFLLYDISKPDSVIRVLSNVSDDELYKTSINAREYAIKNMTWEYYADKIIDIMESTK